MKNEILRKKSKFLHVQGNYINYSVHADVVLNTTHAKIAAISRKAGILLCTSRVIDNATFLHTEVLIDIS